MDEISKGQMWTGRVLSGLIVLFLLLDAVFKFIKPAPVVETCVKLGLPVEIVTPIGVVLLVCTLLYAVPRTAVLGAALLTGYLGGAVAINWRAGTPIWSNVLFPVYMGVVMWLALYLRNMRVRAVVGS